MIVIVVVIIMMAAMAASPDPIIQRVFANQGDQLVELALVEPDAACGWADIELDAVAIDLPHGGAINGGEGQRHGLDSV